MESGENKNFMFSIIIPHKNTPDLLERCVNSIPKRDDLEIIIIDDNSSPEIVNFENFPLKNDDSRNLKIIFDKSNKGAGHARNLGVENAGGKFLIFADSDDFFILTFNNILDKYKNSNYDIIYLNACSLDSEYYTNTDRLKNYLYKLMGDYMSKEHHELGELELKYLFASPWCKIVRKSIIENNNIKFDETPVSNDLTFSYLIGHYAKNIFVDPTAVYCVTVRNNSLSKNKTDEMNLIRIGIYARRDKFLKSHNIPLPEMMHFTLLYGMRNNKNSFDKGCKILIELGYTQKEIKSGLKKIFYGKLRMYAHNVKAFLKLVLHPNLK